MGLFLKYLKQRRRYIAAGAAFCAVFALSFYFYRLPLGGYLRFDVGLGAASVVVP